MKGPRLLMLVLTISAADLSASVAVPAPENPPIETVRVIAASAFAHATGRAGGRGQEVDHSRDRAGFLLLRPQDPLWLEPGFYRATFVLRRGHYPSEGFLRPTFTVFRIQLYDASIGELIADRELQVSELDANRYEGRWLDFSMEGREGHIIEPRVYWPGLVNGEVESVRVERLPVDTPERLEEKARAIAERLRRHHLENGFVVSRKPGGEPDEIGDATTYTGFYAAALSWKLALRKDALTAEALENAIEALHNAVKGTPENPIITRFVDADGKPHEKSPSKDVYTAFFFAVAAAYPQIENEALRRQIRTDVDRIATRFLQDDLNVRGGAVTLTSLTPHFNANDVRKGIQELTSDKGRSRKALKLVRSVKTYIPFQETFPGMNDLAAALEQRDETRIYKMVVPTMNGLVTLAERMVDLLKENARSDLVGWRNSSPERPGKRLADLLADSIRKLPPPRNGKRFENLSDLRILASNALLALHIVKTAAVITGKSQFDEYYRQNLYTQDALLKTAMDWYGIEDELLRLTVGNAEAGRERRGYLSMLAAYNLYTLETNPSVRESYRGILAREAAAYRFDDNPLVDALAATAGLPVEKVSIWRALTLYPREPEGFGDAWWKENGRRIAENFGGGVDDGYSREPLPVSHRPRDSFLWQRNARRLRGDHVNRYPGTEFLFLYWQARKAGLIPAPALEPSVRSKTRR